MNVDVNNQDYGYTVYCDGVKLEKCLRADDKAGTAECYELDEDGAHVITGEIAATIKVKGKILIVKDK